MNSTLNFIVFSDSLRIVLFLLTRYISAQQFSIGRSTNSNRIPQYSDLTKSGVTSWGRTKGLAWVSFRHVSIWLAHVDHFDHPKVFFMIACTGFWGHSLTGYLAMGQSNHGPKCFYILSLPQTISQNYKIKNKKSDNNYELIVLLLWRCLRVC